MLKKLKKQLGYTKRGLTGYFQNNFSKIPNIPADLTPSVIGKSVNNKPINCYQIGDGPIKVLYTFGIHGNEIGTVKLAQHLLVWLKEQKEFLQKFKIFVIPCLNPDGFKLARKSPQYLKGGNLGRFNAHNVDLNRNFLTPSFQKKSVWSFGKNFSESSEVYCGEFGNSEPETKAFTDFIEKEKIKILFMFHNAGREVMSNKNELSKKLVNSYCEKTGFKYVSEENWVILKQTGTAKEWCDLHEIAYVEVEGSTRWGSDRKKQKNAIQATLDLVAGGGIEPPTSGL